MPFLKNLHASSKAFFTDLLHSCYDMEWYRAVRTRPLGEAVRYAAALFALFAALTGAAIAPGMVHLVQDIRGWTDKNIPDGAEFRIEKGQFSTTMPSPTVMKGGTGSVLLDASVTGLNFPEAAPKDAVLVVGRDALFVRDSDAEQRSFAFKDTPDFRTDKSAFIGLIDRWGPWLALFILLLAVIGTFLGLVFAEGLYILLTAAFTSLVAGLAHISLTFRQLAAVGLHAITLPLLVDIITGIFGLRLPYAFSFVYLMFFVAVLADERARPSRAVIETK